VKIRRITKQQYIDLAKLKLPVYSSAVILPERSLLDRLTNKNTQLFEHKNCEQEASKSTHFHTLVDEE